jgi:hypothetical protein
MIVKTDFNRGGAGDLVKYIGRDRERDGRQKVPLRNQAGRELTEEEIQQFIEQSREFGFERHLIVAPDPDGGYTPAEVGENTRRLAQQQFGREPQTRYLYGVHTDSCHPHAHVAATGREEVLRMDRREIQRLRSRARSQFREKERLKERNVDRDQERAEERREQAHEKELDPEARKEAEPDQEMIPEPDREPEMDREPEAEPEREPEPERDFGMGGGQ